MGSHMNKRVETLAKAMQTMDRDSWKPGTPESVKTFDQYKRDAEVLLAEVDNVTLVGENVSRAIVDAGYETFDYLQQFLNIAKELNMVERGQLYTLVHMQRAWAKGHENGFWIARDGNSIQPDAEEPTVAKSFYTKTDLQDAEAQGFFSGWTNGILSMGELPSDPAELPLLGAEHGNATNPYSLASEK